jgi:succinyl-CoA synthetase alpha subunit
MSIIVDNETKLVISGLTGREGSFHGLRNRNYGTDVVAGVTPKKGGQDVEGIPIFDTIAEARQERGANTSMIFVPARFAAAAMNEAIDAGIETVITITEHIPVHDMLDIYWKARDAGVRLIGPNCPGVLSPGKANVGIIPAQFFEQGSIGVVSKSGTLTYQIGNELKQAGLGNSTIVGIGGDPIVGSDFIDILTLFEEDDETELIVMVGEIGGDAEERAADFIAEKVSKPVVAYIAGFTAPPGKQMGHAGAIISGSSGTAEAKKQALEAQGIRVGKSPTETAQLAAETIGDRCIHLHLSGLVQLSLLLALRLDDHIDGPRPDRDRLGGRRHSPLDAIARDGHIARIWQREWDLRGPLLLVARRCPDAKAVRLNGHCVDARVQGVFGDRHGQPNPHRLACKGREVGGQHRRNEGIGGCIRGPQQISQDVPRGNRIDRGARLHQVDPILLVVGAEAERVR